MEAKIIEWKPSSAKEALTLCQEVWDALADCPDRNVFIYDNKTGMMQVNPVLKINQPLIKVMWAIQCLSLSGDIIPAKNSEVILRNMDFQIICNTNKQQREKEEDE